MQSPLLFISIFTLAVTCSITEAIAQNVNADFDIEMSSTIKKIIQKKISSEDTTAPDRLKEYSTIEYERKELLSAAPGTKSVLFNSDGSKLYAMNLEGMSIYEFDQPTRKLIKEFKFKPTKGQGWDYEKDKPISSFQEKPVEACLSHDDKILWVSLHNAEGIVPIRVDSIDANPPPAKDKPAKKIKVIYPGTNEKDSFYVPLIKTGKTPKIISRTADSKYLLVSNWHSHNVSVLETNMNEYPYAKVISTIPVSDIPRGIVVDDKNNRSFVAIMGGASISVINNSGWLKEDDIKVASNPRHIVLDSSGRLFVSYNKLAKIACIDATTGTTLFTVSTAAKPRTIMLSKNHKFLFVTCYSSDTVEVFKISDTGFSKVISLPCKGHPVGVDIFEDDNKLEAWVCSYSNGTISVFTFKKSDEPMIF
ncbi:MAG TPA: YncE family protein [Chitinophagaceae bacterium]|nr:YncE family protein [Chitinophagaceae bacterium]